MTEPKTDHEAVDPPQLPTSPSLFLIYLKNHPNTPLHELVKPFIDFEDYLRSQHIQSPTHNDLVNLIDIFAPETPQIRFRKSNLNRDNIIMPLRKLKTGPAVVGSLENFRNNFDIFAGFVFGSDFDWSNIVVAGGAATTCLAPMAKKLTRGERRQQYLKLSPKGDLDIFLYGLPDEEAGHERILKLEKQINRYGGMTVVRTVNCLTLISQYPQRHIQIILKLFQSISQILTGFDVDSCGFAYNGQTVYATPRSVTALIVQCNILDLSRRSPSYERRLMKYATRGYEIYYESLDRTRVNPDIFKVPTSETHGLARLLSLEHQHISESAYPPLNFDESLALNFNESNYTNLVIPWGTYSSTEIKERISEIDSRLNMTCCQVCAICLREIVNGGQAPCGHIFDYDCLVQWLDGNNSCPLCSTLVSSVERLPKASRLHRHLGSMKEVMADFCGQCPLPETREDQNEFLENSKHYISGTIKFLKDKQPMGSFYPLSPAEYVESAYLSH